MIIVEDGTNIPNSNSYVTVIELDNFAALRGYTLPASTPDKEVLLIKGADYTESFRSNYQGKKTFSNQSLQFPRTGVYVDCYPVGGETIPQDLKNAQLQAAIEVSISGGDIQPNTSKNIKKEKVDVIEVEYQDGNGSLYAPTFPKVDTYLEPLFKQGGGLLVEPIR
jgi:hypothetical protein